MHYFLSNAGVRIPQIVYGTAWKKDETQSLVRTALLQGFRGLDTAGQPRHYDERAVGAGVVAWLNADAPPDGKVSREDLYLQTKFTPLAGQDPARIPYDPSAPLGDQVRQSYAASLQNLQTDYLDGLLLHSPLASDAQTLEVWRAMEALADTGQVRQIGISNCYGLEQLKSLWESARVKPAVLQNRFYAETDYDREIRAYCREHQIIYQSFWTLAANPQILAQPIVRDLAASYHRTPAQILFRYLTQSRVVPLTGTRSQTHMREDLSIFEFELTELERQAMDALFSAAPTAQPH
jgi:diketogulonate reductase-like aldo/keto reductase